MTAPKPTPKPEIAAPPATRPRPPASGDASLEVRFLRSVFAEISGLRHRQPVEGSAPPARPDTAQRGAEAWRETQ